MISIHQLIHEVLPIGATYAHFGTGRALRAAGCQASSQQRPNYGSVPLSPVGSPRGRENCARGCPPDAVVSLALEAVDQSGAGALLEGLRTVATSTPVRFGTPHRTPRAAPSALYSPEEEDGIDATAHRG